MTGPELAALLGRFRFAQVTERELQDSIARILVDARIGFEREPELSERDRIDFLIDGLGVEVKCQGGLSALTRQAQRYLLHDRVAELAVVSTLARLCAVPDMQGKKVTAIHVRAGL